MTRKARTVTRLIALLGGSIIFIAIGITLHPISPRTTYLYFALAALYLFTFAARIIIPLFLTPRQRAAASITFAFIPVAMFFIIGFLFALGILAAGIAYIIANRGLIIGIAICLFGLLLFLYQLARLLIFRRQTKSAIVSTLRKHGFCPHCGYDLRESFTRCPECGSPVPPERRNRTRSVSEGGPPRPENIEI